jgi:chemotaxis protein CheD
MMEERGKHYLYPATLYASVEPCIVTTVLGSCVSVCLWDNILNVGGINHFMLPLWNGEGLASPKFGSIANEKLLEKMYSFGCKKVNIKAKVFGGGEVIETTIKHFNIGERNIKIALEFLEEEKIPIIAQSLGGKLGRKIIFNTQTGEILHKLIQKTCIIKE